MITISPALGLHDTNWGEIDITQSLSPANSVSTDLSQNMIGTV